MKKTLLLLGASLVALSSQAQQRVPLFEVFTSSTCPPCNNGNKVYEGVLVGKPKADYVSIKYQEYFPGTGDPYCTDETKARFKYYSLTAIPYMMIDGGWKSNAANFSSTVYQQYKAVAAKYSISGQYSLKNRVVTGKIKFSPLVTVPAGAVLYIAITEDSTIKNKKTNGETVFYNVVKKMVPNHQGTPVTAIAVGNKDSVSFTYTFPATNHLPRNGSDSGNRLNFNAGTGAVGTWSGPLVVDLTANTVENFNNLRVAAWIEYASGGTAEVYNAANLARVWPAAIGNVSESVNGLTVYPNPATNAVSVELDMKSIDLVSATLTSMTGAVVATQSVPCVPGKNKVTFETSNLANGVYNIIVLDSKNNSFGQKVLVAH